MNVTYIAWFRKRYFFKESSRFYELEFTMITSSGWIIVIDCYFLIVVSLIFFIRTKSGKL